MGVLDFFHGKGHDIRIIGDDLYVTNPIRLQKGIDGGFEFDIDKTESDRTLTEALNVMGIANREVST